MLVVSYYSSLKCLSKKSGKTKVRKFTSEMNETVRILVNSICKTDRMEMRVHRKSCTVRLREEMRHADSKFRTVTNNVMVEDSKRCNILL